MGTLLEDVCTFMIISRWFCTRVGNVSDKIYRENQNTRFLFNDFLYEKSFHLWDRWCGKIWQRQIVHRWQFNTSQKKKSHN